MATEDTSGVPDEKGVEEGDGGPEPPVAQAIRRLDDGLGRLEVAVVGLALLLLVGVGLYQSIAAHLFDKNDPWPYEVIRYSVFFVAMAGAALASQRSRLINLDVITRMLTPRNRAILRIATSLVALVACVLLFKGGLDVRNLPAQQAVEYDIIPAPMALLALPLGALLVGVHLLLHALIDVSYLIHGQVAPETEQKVH